MDGVTLTAIAFGVGAGAHVVGITAYAVTTRNIAKDALHKATTVENVAARKDVIDERFKAIKSSLDEIKADVKAIRTGGMPT